MSYLALARKWRPRRFEDVRGQTHVIQALANALDRDRLHPAILLTGTRGVGKTTLARIIAKGLNCEKGVSANPCGACSACMEVNDGRFIDLLEIDAASNTGVDNVRGLIDNAQYSPVRGRYKVYLIDEVHMLSKGAFNALLKTLEEPPPHVKFILATTDPQKLPVTVLSRCLQFSLKRLPVVLIRDTLAEVLLREGVEFEAGVVAEIARAADGSMRDGLSLLDQAIAFAGGGKLMTDAVEEMVGAVGRRTLLGVLQALATHDAAGVLAGIERLDAQAPDYGALISDLAAKLQRIALLQQLPDAKDEDEEAVLLELVGAMAPEDVQLYYQIAVLGRRDLPWAPDPRLGFEMTLLRMLAFRPEVGGGAVSGAASPAAAAGGRSTAPSRPPVANAAAPATMPAAAAAPVMTTAPAIKPAQSAAGATTLAAISTAPMQVAEPAVNGGGSASGAGTVTHEPSAWSARIETLNLDQLTRQLARHCAWLGEDNGALRLQLEYGTRHLLNDERRKLIERALQLRVAVEIAAEGAVIDSPTQHDRLRAEQKQKTAEASFETDPTVQDFRRLFGATVRPGSVQPLD